MIFKQLEYLVQKNNFKISLYCRSLESVTINCLPRLKSNFVQATMGFETPEEGYLAKILISEGTKDVPIGKVR